MATLYISYFGKVHESCAGVPLSCEAMTTSTTSAVSTGDIPAAACVVAFHSGPTRNAQLKRGMGCTFRNH